MVVLTGVSRGLGAALFEEFDAAGCRILAIGRRFMPAQHEAQRAQPDRVRLRAADLSDLGSLPDAQELAGVVRGATDLVLIHNAAVVEPVGAIGTLAPDEVAATVTVNLTAPIVLTNAVVGAWAAAGPGTGVAAGPGTGVAAETGPGRAVGTAPGPDASGIATPPPMPLTILYISSGAAHRQIGGLAVYSVTKSAGEAFCAAVAAQHAGEARIRVAVVQPGVVDTGMQTTMREYAHRDVYFPDREHFLALHERGELADPRAVARRIIAEHLPALAV
jgi:benzil reductase ((S)-benzoin forming)